MTTIKSKRDGKFIALQKGYYFREKTRMEAIIKLLQFMKTELKVV